MTFPDGNLRSDGSFHLKRNVTHVLKFSEPLSGQYDLVVIRKHYPYVPMTVCPFYLPTMRNTVFEEIVLTHDNVRHYGISFTVEDCNSLNIVFQESSCVLSQTDRDLKLLFGRAKYIQLLLFSHSPTNLLAKVDLQVVAEIRAEDHYQRQKRKYVTLPSTSVLQPQEEIERKKKFLVHEICTLYKMKGKNMDVSDLTSMLDISKSLIEKSTKK
jgi:hypothetical protein